MIIDSHCHLDFLSLYNQLDEVLKRAKSNKIEYMLSICTTLESFKKINVIIDKYKNVYGTFGIHPHETKDHLNINANYIINIKKKYKKIIGVGETGLDFYYNHSDKADQIKSFEEHIKAAIKLNIPLIIHSRNADNDMFDTLNNFKSFDLKILMHCFTGSKNFAKKLLELNAYFSASGIITFKNSIDLQETFKFLPLEKLLIETDSPYLAPVPNRGKKNEPSFVKYTAEKLASIKDITTEHLIKSTTTNFNNLFS